jgi:predicted NBD/HSP70 family sugar kinase
MTFRERPPTRHRVAIGSNPERNRTHNRRVVLDVVRTHGALGRTEIARLTRLTPQAVANIVGDLCDEDMLVEVGRRRAGRGQPPIQFAVNPEGPMTAGAEIAIDRIATVLLDLAGSVRARRTLPLAEAAPETVARLLSGEIAALRRSVGSGRLLGVGVVLPGPFAADGVLAAGPTTLPGWGGVDALTVIEQATGEMVVMENDATAAAVGERLFGAGRDFASFCLVYFGVGLGLGIIHEGRPFRGAFGNAGEIGQVLVRGHAGAPGEGPLEQFASLFALRERLQKAGLGAGGLDLDSLLAAKDPTLLGWIAEAADHLAPAIAMIENLFDPETVILGGALPDSVIDALIVALGPLPASISAYPQRRVPRVLRGQSGRWTAALGAAALPLMETLTPRLDLAIEPISLATAETEPT